MRQIIVRQAVTQQVSGPPGGMHRWPANPPLNACQAAGRASLSRVAPSFRADEAVRGRGGRTAQRPSWRGRPDWLGRPFPDHKFRDRKYLLAASETTIIHSLTGQLLERDQPLPLNGWHIRSPPQPWPPHPPGSTARADSNRLYCISAGQKTGDISAPGRGRTDTGDPFRGPASSFGLRGLGNDTSAEPGYSRPAYGVEKDPLRCIYSILRS
jgi:hypothetical protein